MDRCLRERIQPIALTKAPRCGPPSLDALDQDTDLSGPSLQSSAFSVRCLMFAEMLFQISIWGSICGLFWELPLSSRNEGVSLVDSCLKMSDSVRKRRYCATWWKNMVWSVRPTCLALVSHYTDHLDACRTLSIVFVLSSMFFKTSNCDNFIPILISSWLLLAVRWMNKCCVPTIDFTNARALSDLVGASPQRQPVWQRWSQAVFVERHGSSEATCCRQVDSEWGIVVSIIQVLNYTSSRKNWTFPVKQTRLFLFDQTLIYIFFPTRTLLNPTLSYVLIKVFLNEARPFLLTPVHFDSKTIQLFL